MVDVFVVLVFHHGGNFVRGVGGKLVYQNGKEERFPEMDLDFVNFGDLVTLFKGLGYQSYKAVYWYDPSSTEFESEMNILTGDAGINAMRENQMKHPGRGEFHIYFDHPVDEPEVVEDAAQNRDTAGEVGETAEELNSSSSSDDGYESTEDVLYKLPPAGIDSDSSESDNNGGVTAGKRKRGVKGKKNVVTPIKKVVTPKKKVITARKKVVTPKKQGKKKRQFRTRVNERAEGSGNRTDARGEARDQGPDVQPDYAVGGRGEKFPEFNDEYAHGEGRFELGTRFATVERFNEVVKDSFIAEGREVKWIKNDKERVRVGCGDKECPYLVHLSYNKNLQCYQLKTYHPEHTCARDLDSNAADQHWLSKKIEKRMSTQPHMNTKEATDFLKGEFSLCPHPKMVYRAVKEAREKIQGNEKEQYKRSRDYCEEILRSNPDSSARLELMPIPDGPPIFDKLYICLDTCKQGFKDGCRPLLHLDGCFLKTYYGGWLLAAVAQDANNQFYVVAYGVVRTETKKA
ncbi:uncharacterized protein LOC130934418 [Arachis stenosperma]|uniref:uncharacterized protein LOC130934418 n=1 Tax=Arachis stenosperma TaxID=217475 RepID=UPI0025ACA7B4|nr:uncharacterized protein LOC130934418 [Arachis stenosperma]